MNNQEQQKEKQIKLDNWPVLFREWTDAYIVQILGNELNDYTQRVKKDVREGLIDKLMRRMQLIFDLPLAYKNENPNFLRLVLSDELDVYLEEDELLSCFLKWRDSGKDNIEILQLILSDVVDWYFEKEEIQSLLNRWEDGEKETLRLILWDVVDLYLEGDEVSEYIMDWNDNEKEKTEVLKSVLSDVVERCLGEEEIQILFEKYTDWEKQKISNYFLPEETSFFLQDENNQKSFEEWRERVLQEEKNEWESKYNDAKDDMKKLMKKLGEARDGKYEKLNAKYSKKEKELKDIVEKGKERMRWLRRLDVTDFLKRPVFNYVSQQESDFYCLLLSESFSKDILESLKEDKWWVVDIKVRVQLLRSIELLMAEEKWRFIEKDFFITAMKILRPHEYILTKASAGLLRRVCDLYSVGNSQIFRFCKDNALEEVKDSEDTKDSAWLEIEYSDVLDLEMPESSSKEKAGMTTGEKILALAKSMDELSLELSAFIEKNTVYPDLKKEIEKMYCKEKEQKKC